MSTHFMRFTALPNGLRDGRPRLSAHAAFRLDPGASDGTLADFPAAVAWPTTAITWTVLLRRGTTTVDYPAALDGDDQRDAGKWSAIFDPGLTVRAFSPPTNRAGLRIRSFRNARLAARWQSLYATLGAALDGNGERPAAGDDPALGPLAGFEAAGLWSQARSKDFDDESLLQQIEDVLDELGAVPSDLAGSAQARERRDILEFRRFFRRKVNDPDAVTMPPSLDFHQLTTACGAHPGLLRPLGLVVDLVVDAGWDQVEKALSGYPDLVSVIGRPERTGLDPDVVIDETTPPGEVSDPEPVFRTDPSPWTRTRADATTFALAPRAGSDLSPRLLLRLDDTTRFAPVTLEVEQATLTATGFGASLQLMKARRTRSTPTNEAPPALRATGIALTRVDRALRFHERVFQRGDQIVTGLLGTQPGEPVADEVRLDADDVVKGYRLDVRAEGGPWQSVVLRRGRVEVSDGGGWDLENAEGWIVEAPAADDDKDLYLGEEVIRWDGWSPVAPKPGTVIGTDDQLDADRASSAPLPDLPVVVSYRPTPGTLVPLRYGRRYQLRARAVDIAGNGPGPDVVAEDEATDKILVGRLDPVRSPDVLFTAPRLPGEEAERVVLRSQAWNRPAAETGEALAARHVLPPRTTVTEAERHGVLDDDAGRPRPDLYALLAERDAYALQNDGIEDPDDPNPAEEGTSRYFPMLPSEAVRRQAPGEFPVRYLPDPLARAIQVTRADGSLLLDGATVLDLGPDWPERRSARVVVVEGDQVEVGWDAGERLLRVTLPKATVLPLRLSSRFDPADLPLFGLAEWLAQALGVSVSQLGQNPVGRQVLAGKHWMFTPWRSLTLVHAVKQPLTAPELPDSTFSVVPRQLRVTASPLGFISRWHATSTGRLDLLASWDEGVDAGPGTEAPRIRRVETLAAELRRDQAGATDDAGVVQASHRPVHEHADTKYRRITYRSESTTAFLDNFVEPATVTLPADGPAVLDGEAVPGTVVLTGRDGDGNPVTYRRDDGDGGDYQVVADPATSTTSLVRLGEGVPTGVALTVRYATRPISRFSEPVVRDVPASARPAAPRIHSVLPTFGWDLTSSGATTTSTRQPAGVRVWLERPWWSSGLGEQVAVLYLSGTTQPSQAQSPFATQWGRDPIHAAGAVRGSLVDTAFPRRIASSVGLRPPGGPIVRAVPHRVEFDTDRDMWFCDIDLDLRSAWPFVRLAVARWQPNAIVAADPEGSPADTAISLSPVVLADIVQLAPGRVATVSASRALNRRRLSIVVVGPSFTTTSVDTAAPIIEATLQGQPATATSDLDWLDVTGPTALTREASPLPIGDLFFKQHRWSGALLVQPTPGWRYRIVLEEYERYRTDGAVTDARLVRVGRRILLRPQPRDGRRLVYTDVIEVSPAQLA